MSDDAVLPDTEPPIVLSTLLRQTIDAGLSHDYQLAGLPFRIKPDQDTPYVRNMESSTKEQFDTSKEAGEQSFGYWWLRSQSSFHGGAGQEYIDATVGTDDSRLRYKTSRYAYPHTPGQVSIAGALTSTAANRVRAVQATWGGTQRLVTMSGTDNKIYVSTLPGQTGETAYTLGSSGVCADITTDGARIWAACGDKIYRIDTDGTITNTHTLSFSGTVRLGFAKQRLIACVGNKVYELDPQPGTTPEAVSTPIYTNPASTYVYTSVSSGPNAIYLTGYSGRLSELSSMVVSVDSGGEIAISPPIVQFETPPGEIIYAAFFYVSSFFGCATSNGIRVGTFSDYGQPQFGALIKEGTPCYSITGSGALLYVGGRDEICTVDLGTATDQAGRYAYALHADGVGATNTDPVQSITVNDNLVFGTTAAGHIVSQPAYTPTEPATLTTSWTRFSTTEPKQPFYLTVDGIFPAVEDVAAVCEITVEVDSGETVNFTIPGGTLTRYEFGLSALPPAQSFRATFTLHDSGTGHGVLLRSWQIKAQPTAKRFMELILPLMCYDRELGADGQQHGYEGFARERLLGLEAIAADSRVITILDQLTGVSYRGYIRQLQYSQNLSPTRAGGLGGILNVILRLV